MKPTLQVYTPCTNCCETGLPLPIISTTQSVQRHDQPPYYIKDQLFFSSLHRQPPSGWWESDDRRILAQQYPYDGTAYDVSYYDNWWDGRGWGLNSTPKKRKLWPLGTQLPLVDFIRFGDRTSLRRGTWWNSLNQYEAAPDGRHNSKYDDWYRHWVDVEHGYTPPGDPPHEPTDDDLDAMHERYDHQDDFYFYSDSPSAGLVPFPAGTTGLLPAADWSIALYGLRMTAADVQKYVLTPSPNVEAYYWGIGVPLGTAQMGGRTGQTAPPYIISPLDPFTFGHENTVDPYNYLIIDGVAHAHSNFNGWVNAETGVPADKVQEGLDEQLRPIMVQSLEFPAFPLPQLGDGDGAVYG